MDAAEFGPNKSGRLVPTVENQLAFVPDPVPVQVELDSSLIYLLDRASRAIATLGGVAETLHDSYLLFQPFLRREAVLSSRIEGTVASISDLFMYEASRAEKGDVVEVAAYVQALEVGLGLLDTLPICTRLANQVHEKLMRGARAEDKRPGELRERQVWIAPSGGPIQHARFVPAPHSYLPDLLTDWERFVNEDLEMPPLVQCALMHYQFEAIHPYLDGNGRLGRLLIILFFYARKLLPGPFLYLSAYFERNRSLYYDHLFAVSARGEWGPWLRFFLEAVAEEAQDALSRSRRVRELYEAQRRLLQDRRESANALRLLDELFINPFTTTGIAAQTLGLSYAGAKRILERLLAAGVIQVIDQSYPRTFVDGQLLRLLEAPAADAA